MIYQYLKPINLEYIDVPKWIHPDVYISYSKINNAGLGVFAKTDIEPGTFLGEYHGEIVSKFDNDDYAFSYEDNKCISGLDLNKSNYTRYLNCSNSYESENVYCITMKTDCFYSDNKNLKHRKIFYAQKLIKKDTELLYYYGHDYANLLCITYRLGDDVFKPFGE